MKLQKLILILTLALFVPCVAQDLFVENVSNFTWNGANGYSKANPTVFYETVSFDIRNALGSASNFTVMVDEGDGVAQGIYNRLASDGTINFTQISYNIVKLATSDDSYLMKDYTAVSLASTNIIGNGLSIPGSTTQGYSFFVSVPINQDLSAGTYTDTFNIKLYNKAFGSITLDSDGLEHTVPVTVTIVVNALQSMEIYAVGGGIDFGEAAPGENQSVDVHVYSNTIYDLVAESTNGEVMVHSSHPLITLPYNFEFGPEGSLSSYSVPMSPSNVTVIDDGSSTSYPGTTFKCKITVDPGFVPLSVLSGSYTDTIKFTLTMP